MPSTQKIERVAALKQRIEASGAVLLADFRGLTVTDASEVRSSLREAGTRFMVVKNSLMKRAADDAGLEGLSQLIEGPTGVAFVEADPVLAAKRMVEAGRKYPALVLKGGYLEGRLLSREEAQSLATLESREVMLSNVAGLIRGEISRAARMFQAAQSRFLALAEALRDKLESGQPAKEEATTETEAESSEEGRG